MKQFNLEEYLKNPGRKIVTRNGEDVRIICTDRMHLFNNERYPIIALVKKPDGSEMVASFKDDGQAVDKENLDLFFENKKGWINCQQCRWRSFLHRINLSYKGGSRCESQRCWACRYDTDRMGGIVMKTIEERAKEHADRHKAQEIAFFGENKRYSYTMVYNVELASYVSGAKEQKAIDEEVRLKKCDDMTEAEYNREIAFVDWYLKNGKGTPTYSDAIEWARKEVIEKAREWFADYLMEIGYPDDWMRDSQNMESGEERFIKAMED